jgi:hypothetical protein
LEQHWREWQQVVSKALETAELFESREVLKRAAAPVKRGRPPLDWLIPWSIPLPACKWREQTGRKPGATGGGRFEEFVAAFLAAAGRVDPNGRPLGGDQSNLALRELGKKLFGRGFFVKAG